jgi:polyhydroxyalkanoate synthesis repressor PhaR
LHFDQPTHEFGQLRISGHCGHLALPEVEIPLSEIRGVRRLVRRARAGRLPSATHGASIAGAWNLRHGRRRRHRPCRRVALPRRNRRFAQCNNSCQTTEKQGAIRAVASNESAMAETNGSSSSESKPIVIKKYANRRLYNTATSSYVTLDHLCQMVKDGQEFVVHDAKSGENITHQVLTQIIVEEEAKGHNLLPIAFLRQLIRLYDDSLQAFVPGYLEVSMENFTRNQGRMREQMEKTFGGMFPFAELEEMGRQNMALFQRAMSMFTPSSEAQAASTTKTERDEGDEIAALKKKLNDIQSQLDALARKTSENR